MKKISVPVKIINVTEDDMKLEGLGLQAEEPEAVDTFINVNVDAITAYYEVETDNTVSLHLNNSESPWKVFLRLEEFEELLDNAE